MAKINNGRVIFKKNKAVEIIKLRQNKVGNQYVNLFVSGCQWFNIRLTIPNL